MKLNQLIKKLIPYFIINIINIYRIRKVSYLCYKYDINKFISYSNILYRWNNIDKLLGQIIAEYHVIEKGLTMQDMRLGFGKNILMDLINHCELYSTRYEAINEQFLYAIRVIKEYEYVHKINNYLLEKDVKDKITKILLQYDNVIKSDQINISKVEYFKYTESSFDDFSNSRHSVRSFSGIVDIEKIKLAIKLAQNSPSACNRQPNRVYILQNKNIINSVLATQSGNRGFGHQADKIIILTVELGVFLSLSERNDAYVNGGIYAMNLLYALHFYKIGACALNWCAMPEKDKELRKIIEIPESEIVILLIACGEVPDEFKLAASFRNDYTKILKVI